MKCPLKVRQITFRGHFIWYNFFFGGGVMCGCPEPEGREGTACPVCFSRLPSRIGRAGQAGVFGTAKQPAPLLLLNRIIHVSPNTRLREGNIYKTIFF